MLLRSHHRRLCYAFAAAGAVLWSCGSLAAQARSVSTAVPAGASAAIPPSEEAIARAAAVSGTKVSEKHAREAEDAYIEGARHVERNNLPAAVKSFERAVELNPTKHEYVLALAVVQEHTLSLLVQDAAKARLLGDNAKADSLLAQARALDPENSVIAQHALNLDAAPVRIAATALPGSGIAPLLGGPVHLEPDTAKHSIHVRGSAQDLARGVYTAFGLQVVIDPSVSSSAQGKLDLDDVDFETASRVVGNMMHVFAVPLQPKVALVAKDSKDQRDRLSPKVEETIALPGMTGEQMNELATIARTVFELQQVTASPATGSLLVRGDELFNDTATTEIYTLQIVGSVRCV